MSWADRPLAEVLRAARPKWTGKEVAAAHKKLALAGIHNVDDLLPALDDHLKRPLNLRLQGLGLKTFTVGTVDALRSLLFGRRDDEHEDAHGLKVPSSGVPVARATSDDNSGTLQPTVARHLNLRIDQDAIISESTEAGWGVLIIRATHDFRVSVKIKHDAGSLKPPWSNYLLLGLVRPDTHVPNVALSDEPWTFGTWLAPGNSPIQVWNGLRSPNNPVQMPELPQRLQAGQTLHLERSSGKVSISVDELPPVPLPMALSRFMSHESHRMPCILLGPRTEVRLWITLGANALRQAEAEMQKQVSEPPAEEQQTGDQEATPALREEPRLPPELQTPEKLRDVDDSKSEQDTKSEEEEDMDCNTLGFSPESGSDESPSSTRWSIVQNDQEENDLIKSKRFSVGDLVRLFEQKKMTA